MRLIIESAGHEVEFPLTDGAFVVGRERTCDIVFHDPSLSRRHFMCTLHGDEIVVRDLGTKNGTFLGHQRIEEARPQPGVRLRAGNCFIHFAADPIAAGAPGTFSESPPAAAAAPLRLDLAGAVPDAEDFEDDDEPTPVDLRAQEEAEADGARLVVKGERWFVQDAATGIEVEIVPVQPEQGHPDPLSPVAAAANLPAVRGDAAGLPARVQATSISVLPLQGRLQQVWANPRRRIHLLVSVCVGVVFLAALVVAFKSKPPPEPVSPATYRAEIRKAVAHLKDSDHDAALAVLHDLMKPPMGQRRPRLADMLISAIQADKTLDQDFAGGKDEAEAAWEEVKEYPSTPEDVREAAEERLTWVQREDYNMAYLEDARQFFEQGNYDKCILYIKSVMKHEDSMFHSEAKKIYAKVHKALIDQLLEQADRKTKAQDWPGTIASLRKALGYDERLAKTVRPKIARLERYQAHKIKLAAAEQLLAARRYADALDELRAIAEQSPYATTAKQLRAQCKSSGAVDRALTAYNGQRAEEALKILTDAELQNTDLYNRIRQVAEARKKAWEAINKQKFDLAKGTWKSITNIEPNTRNQYFQEASRELDLIAGRKQAFSGQLVDEAEQAVRIREFDVALQKFSRAFRLDSTNQDALAGLGELKRQAVRDYNIAMNINKPSPRKALGLLQDVMKRVPVTAPLYEKARKLSVKIEDRLEKEEPK